MFPGGEADCYEVTAIDNFIITPKNQVINKFDKSLLNMCCEHI